VGFQLVRSRIAILLIALTLGACTGSSDNESAPDLFSKLHTYELHEGFLDLYWDEHGGRLILKIEELGNPFIYQSALARGVGSNDLGLDRGQLGATRVVEFQKSGPKVLMLQHNLNFRAESNVLAEREAVRESFAASVVWGFETLGEREGAIFVDATDFLLRDAHGIAAQLKLLEEGDYAVDPSRSAIYMPRTRAFPDNSEAEAIVTFAGTPGGKILATVVPDPTLITVHMHHSFIRLPDSNYEPLAYDPRAGLIGLAYLSNGFINYASRIGDTAFINYARRHRLQKKDPAAAVSEAVQPIVYYVDRGVPEPVRSALLEGAAWWNEAFETAGYKDAFQVELLPEGVDPLDVRYNVIQWVHRSTRGWSYGSSVLDPRTGEIIKGHVSLGSLRVRQDYLIAEGLLAPYLDEKVPAAMLDMSLARIRQLAAHEVGHTLGVEHNFAASTEDRSSVMDYPFPVIGFDDDGELDLSDAYDVGIGEWDKRVILYGYQSFADGVNEDAERSSILEETVANYKYVADGDARATGTPHPDGNLWDNGNDAMAELKHLLRVREHVLQRFSERNIRLQRPMATLEEVLVPMYLLHRYQIRAAAKLIGGQYFNYGLRGDGQAATRVVTATRQREAIQALIDLLDPSLLRLPQELVDLIPPRPPGFAKSRETFPNTTGNTFDPIGPARSAVSLTLDALLDPVRAARMAVQNATDSQLPAFTELCESLLGATWFAAHSSGVDGLIQRQSNTLALQHFMRLSVNVEAGAEVRAIATASINAIDDWLSARTTREADLAWRSHYVDARLQISRFRDDPAMLEQIVPVKVPPGSPIGAETIQ